MEKKKMSIIISVYNEEKVLDKFSWKNVVDSYEELLMGNKRVD